MTGPSPPDPPHLTRREIEILRLASHGLMNVTIGERLQVTEDTVKSHMRHLMAKLGGRNRTHCVRLGFEWGLLVAPSRARHLEACFRAGACRPGCPSWEVAS